MRPSLPLLLLATTLTLGAACGPRYGHRVPDKRVQNLPFESRIELLAAENDLALAVDRRDEADNEISRAREHLRRAKSRRSEAKQEVSRAKDALSREVAELALAEANARLDYLRAKQKVNVARADIEQLSLRCALARFELARLAAARKTKVEGSEQLSQERFEMQAKACEEDVQSRRAKLAEGKSQEAEAARVAWEAERQALAKKTFDARASPWVESL